ncbi:hypothetical protein N7524_009916 [Penicillium chrysogenum]|nr:hypothetical protein N7524_009916 [Penicillium chrysogenum]
MTSNDPKLPQTEDEQLFNQLLTKLHTEEELKKHHFTMISTCIQHKEDAPKRQAIVLDCEMVTVEGNRKELAFPVVADMFTGDILINHFVNPTSIVRNWQTKYSDITYAAMKAAVKGNIAI